MLPDSSRTAFTLISLAARKDANRITCLAVDNNTQRVFVGLADGHIEEHQLLSTDHSLGTRLIAGKRVSRQAVKTLCALPASQRLAVFCEDGLVAVCSYEQLGLHFLQGVKTATAIAADASASARVAAGRLAVAVKGVSVHTKLLVYVVSPGPVGTTHTGQPVQLLAQVALPDPVLNLTWVGNSIFAQTPGSYKLIQSGNKVLDIAPHLCKHPRMASMASARMGLLLFQDSLLLATDSQGAGARQPIILPSSPLALTHSGLFIIAIMEDAIQIFDRDSSQLVQQIEFSHDDAWVRASHHLPTAEDVQSGIVLLAANSSIYSLQPVAVEQQIRELLKHKRYTQALDLIEIGQGSHADWVDAALCCAGLLMLQDMQIQEALSVLTRCPIPAFQPMQLLHLFPEYTARWLPGVPQKPVWGLHVALRSLRGMCEDHLELQHSAHAHNGPHHTSQQAHGHHSHSSHHHKQHAHYSSSPDHVHMHDHHHDHSSSQPHSNTSHSHSQQSQGHKQGAGHHHHPQRLSGLPSDSAAQPSSQSEIQGALTQQALHDSTVDQLVLDAKRHIATYLLEVRQRTGVVGMEAIDTLLVHLLCDVRDAGALEQLVESPACAANIKDSVAALEVAGLWHALALLRAAHGYVPQALDTWQKLSDGQLVEADSQSGAVHAARGQVQSVAAQSAVSVMSDPQRVPPLLCLSKLSWLLSAAPSSALSVLRSRELPIADVLSLLADREDDIRWQYLHHLVYTRHASEPELHTELALELVECIIRLQQQLASAATPATATATAPAQPSESSTESVATNAQLPDIPPSVSSSHHTSKPTATHPSTHTITSAFQSSSQLPHQHNPLPTSSTPQPSHATISLSPHHPPGPSAPSSPFRQSHPGSAIVSPSRPLPGRHSRQASRALSLAKQDSATILSALSQSLSADLSAATDANATAGATATADASSNAMPDAGLAAGSSATAADRSKHQSSSLQYKIWHLRDVLQLHLQESTLYDASIVLQAVRHTELYREAVQLYRRLQDHAAALRLLALTMLDVEGAISYCRELPEGGEDGWLLLLGLFLKPGNGRQPMYVEACRVLNAEGANLNPLEVLHALSDDMPLHLATDTLCRMMVGTLHRKRQGQVVRALHRAQNLNVRTELALLQSQRVLIREETVCKGCGQHIGERVFYRYPTGAVLCSRCAKPASINMDSQIL